MDQMVQVVPFVVLDSPFYGTAEKPRTGRVPAGSLRSTQTTSF